MTTSLEKMLELITLNKKHLNKMEDDPCLATCNHTMESHIYQVAGNNDLVQRGLIVYLEMIKEDRRQRRRRYKKNFKRRQEEMKQAMEYLSTR